MRVINIIDLSRKTVIYLASVSFLNNPFALYESLFSQQKYVSASSPANKTSSIKTFPAVKCIFYVFFMQIFTQTMPSKQAIFDTGVDFSFGTLAFGSSVPTDVPTNVVAELNGAPAIIGTTKFSGAGVTDSSALRKANHCDAFPGTSVVTLVAVKSVKVDNNYSSRLASYLFQCDNEI